MTDFVKSECPHCRQKIGYSGEKTGAVIPCRACGKSIMLMPIKSDDLCKHPSDDPPTEKQLAYLHDLGVQFDEANLTKRSASCLLEVMLREKRKKESPSGWRLEKIKRLGLMEKLPASATMQDVVELLDSVKYDPPTKVQIKFCKASDFRLKGEVFADELDEILKLDGQPPLQEHLDLFNSYGIRTSGADALAACAYATLIGYFEDFFYEKLGYGDGAIDRHRIAKACVTAMHDPDYGKPTLVREGYWMTFTWPKRKLKEWYRKGAED